MQSKKVHNKSPVGVSDKSAQDVTLRMKTPDRVSELNKKVVSQEKKKEKFKGNWKIHHDEPPRKVSYDKLVN